MQNAHIWHQLHLHGRKIIFATVLLFLCSASFGQKFKWARPNNPGYDDRKISYGFLIGLHTNAYQLQYSDTFTTQKFDTVFAVVPDWSFGFSLGFIVNLRVNELLDLRLTPSVAFYEHQVNYLFTDERTEQQLIETTMVEFPLLAKYKSYRRGNVRMYMIGGIKPAIEASGKKDRESITTSLETKNINFSVEAGFGFDLYFPLFKFSPEIRFSRGIPNLLDNNDNRYGQPLRRINTNQVTIYLLFQ